MNKFELEAKIDDKINYIFSEWDVRMYNGGSKYANKELKKLYLQYANNEGISVELYRKIIYNLMLSDIDMNDGNCTTGTRLYSEILKKRLEETNYKDIDRSSNEKYCRVLNSYRDSHMDELSKEDITKINKYIHDTFKRYPREYNEIDCLGFSDRLISEFNIFLEIKDFSSCLKILDELKLHITNPDIKLVYKQLNAIISDKTILKNYAI